ncbi:MAG: F0F1 ATP synthase subunit B [Proteobacteria bacterium]|nr:F0F1 ATP synthase subunit B [Pseudomonadota bacterium]MBU4298019.1 F0F1 ATP synthase subunit B [Pseudomonadota bacterium]MCG2749579.1 F0F1 ATP synthase subunit B [Desulfobulbaceae bacterium]
MKNNKRWSKIALTALALAAVIGTAGIIYASGGDPHAVEAAGHAAEAAGEAHGAAAHGASSMTGPHGALSPAKLKDFGWRVMNFAALMVILIKFLKKPLVDALKGRQQGIAAEFEDLETRRAEAERNYKEYEARLAGIDDELKTMVEKAVAQGQVEKARIIEEANRAAEGIKRQAEMVVQNEIAEAKRRLKTEIADQAAIMAEEIIKKNLQDTDQNKLVEDYLTKLGGLQK